MARNLVFSELEDWFVLQRRENEKHWAHVIEKYGAEHFFGRILRAVGHGGEIELPILSSVAGFLRWCYEGPWASRDTFYFNCVGRDLSRSEFMKLKDELQRLLGQPDEVFDYYGLSEPAWTNGKSYVRLYHLDSHGNGYERIEVSTDSQWLRTA